MQTSKRVILSIASCVIAAVLLYVGITTPYAHSRIELFQDNQERSELAGSVDTLICGASQLECGLSPSVIDEKLGTTSYNLSANLLFMYGRNYIIRYECERNPVKTVVIDISCDSLSRKIDEGVGLGDLSVMCRMGSIAERIAYIPHIPSLKGIVDVHGRALNDSIQWWYRAVLGSGVPDAADTTDRGYLGRGPVDLTQCSDEDNAAQAPVSVNEPFNQLNVSAFEDLADYCNQRGIDLVVISAPLPRWTLQQFSAEEWDAYEASVSTLCKANGASFYDFSLMKDYAASYSDQISFTDADHVSTVGAQVFSSQLCDILSARKAGQDVSQLFYSSYAEAIKEL